jgi:hypothetical protein
MAKKKRKKQKKRKHQIITDIMIGAISGTIAGVAVELITKYIL